MTNELDQNITPEPAATDHLCIPCDATTMAQRLGLDSARRVQQLAKDGTLRKNERGEYDCPYNVAAYIRVIRTTKPTKRTNLAKKQEESLDIRNARDRMEVLAEWETMVLQKAVVEELAPVFLAVRNGIRQMSGALAQDIMLFVKETAEKIANGEEVHDYEISIKAQKLLSGQVNEKLEAFSKSIAAWAEGKSEGDAIRIDENRQEAQKAQKEE